MSTGAIAMTAILVSGTEGVALIAAGTWLVHRQRILFAASPRPQAQKQDTGTQDKPVDIAARRTGT